MELTLIEPKLRVEIGRDEITSRLRPWKGRYFNYGLMCGDEAEYIGYSGNLYSRLSQHKYSRSFDSVIILEFDSETEARMNERFMIKEFKPNSNYQYL